MAENNMPELHSRKVVDEDEKPVVKGPGTFRKLARILFTDDPEKAAKSIVKNIVEPAIRKSVVDTVATFMIGHPVFGNTPFGGIFNPSNWSSPSSGSTPYWTYSNGTTQAQAPQNAMIAGPITTGGARFNGTVFFKEYNDAVKVLEELHRILREYHMVRLLELYDAADIDGIQYVSNSYGWTDLTGSSIYPSGNGYILSLPPVKVLN